ncbi:hypothetical protein BT93_A1963 [Corymbia citriodora subsp. variegata]|nr:hypothetical protein BT93_A1963 [Corymbia citriodora subsp. variegata]
MGLWTSFCCCFYNPVRVSSDVGDSQTEPLRASFPKNESRATIVVPHFPTKMNFSRL